MPEEILKLSSIAQSVERRTLTPDVDCSNQSAAASNSKHCEVTGVAPAQAHNLYTRQFNSAPRNCDVSSWVERCAVDTHKRIRAPHITLYGISQVWSGTRPGSEMDAGSNPVSHTMSRNETRAAASYK